VVAICGREDFVNEGAICGREDFVNEGDEGEGIS
jgi:uncharacterized protein YacL (UPF0231 family)